MNNDASLSDYVELWEKGLPRGTPRARRLIVLAAVALAATALLMGLFYVAFGMVLGRFW